MRQEKVQGPCELLRKAFDATLASPTKLYLGGQEKQGSWPLRISKVLCSHFYIVKMGDRDVSAVEC